MSKTYPQLHLENQLCFSVYTLSRLITQSYQPLLKALGLTYPQYLVMLVLWQAEEEDALPVAVKYLCAQLLLDTGTLTPLLKRMEAAGLIVRSRASDDERVVLIQLTAAGLALRDAAAGIPMEILCRSGIDLQEGEAVRNELHTLIRHWTDQAG